MKARSELEHRGDPAIDFNRASIRFREPRYNAQQRALSGSVAADHGQPLSLFDLKRNSLESVEFRGPLALKQRGQVLPQKLLPRVKAEALPNVLALNSRHDYK